MFCVAIYIIMYMSKVFEHIVPVIEYEFPTYYFCVRLRNRYVIVEFFSFKRAKQTSWNTVFLPKSY